MNRRRILACLAGLLASGPAYAQRGTHFGGHTGFRGGSSGHQVRGGSAAGRFMRQPGFGVMLPARPALFSNRTIPPTNSARLFRPRLAGNIARVAAPGFSLALIPHHPFFGQHFHRHRFFFPEFGFPFGFGTVCHTFRIHHFSAFQCRSLFVRPGFVTPFFAPVLGVPFAVPLGVPVAVLSGGPAGAAEQVLRQAETPMDESASADSPREADDESAATGLPRGEQRSSPPTTLLAFKDRSIYGVTDYWLEGSRLHYITSYGATNSLPIEQLDLEVTAQLNWGRGVAFTLRLKPSSR